MLSFLGKILLYAMDLDLGMEEVHVMSRRMARRSPTVYVLGVEGVVIGIVEAVVGGDKDE